MKDESNFNYYCVYKCDCVTVCVCVYKNVGWIFRLTVLLVVVWVTILLECFFVCCYCRVISLLLLHTHITNMSVAKSVVLKEPFDEGIPGPEHFDIVESALPEASALEEGGIQVKIVAMSADPYLRMGVKSTGAVGSGGIMRLYA
jgi:hypothetical protein